MTKKMQLRMMLTQYDSHEKVFVDVEVDEATWESLGTAGREIFMGQRAQEWFWKNYDLGWWVNGGQTQYVRHL